MSSTQQTEYTTVDREVLHAAFTSIGSHFSDVETKLHAIEPDSVTDVTKINALINNYRTLQEVYLSMDDSLELVLIRVRRLEAIFAHLNDEQLADIPDMITDDPEDPPVTNDPTPDPDENDPTPDPQPNPDHPWNNDGTEYTDYGEL